MNWLELSNNNWLNLDHLVTVNFVHENDPDTGRRKFKATLITVKPGGSDRSFIFDADAEKLKTALETCSGGFSRAQ